MTTEVSKDIFICHATEDKNSVVLPIKDACGELGISTWVDEDEIQWGESIAKRVQEAVVSSRFVLVVISESSVVKNWPDAELNAALHLEIASGQVRVLPLLCGNPDKLLTRYPFIAGKAYKVWDSDPREIATQIKARMENRAMKTHTSKPKIIGNEKNMTPRVILIATAVLFLIAVSSYLFFSRQTDESIIQPKQANQSSSGNNSPVVTAGGDVTIQIGKDPEPKPELITSHDGAGAMLMKEPDFREFLSLSIGGSSEKAIGRLTNGTALADLHEHAEQSPDSPPWLKVRVLDGKFKDQQGWLIESSVRKP